MSLSLKVKRYWEKNVSNWKITDADVGSEAFFLETERYRFDKLRYLAPLIDFSQYSGKAVLDVGCGLGNDTSRFAAAGAEITGVDIADEAVRLTKANFAYRGLKGDIQQMDGCKLAFPDNSFDVVYCHTVLHFTHDPEQLIGEIRRVLKPGGKGIVMTINRNSWMMVLHRLLNVEIDYLDSPVFHPYSQTEFRSLFSGFSKIDLVVERFPVRTEVHKGLKSMIYNLVFVDLFNLLPKKIIDSSGHHLLAFLKK